MIDKYMNRLMQLVMQSKISGTMIEQSLRDNGSKEHVRQDNFITIDQLMTTMNRAKYDIENEPKPYKKIMFVEDGSVDVDALVEELERTNPEIKVVVYRSGATRPTLTDIKEDR